MSDFNDADNWDDFDPDEPSREANGTCSECGELKCICVPMKYVRKEKL